METVLDKVTKSDVRIDPFPHIVVENALPTEAADVLLHDFPPAKLLTEGKELGENQRVSYPANKVRTNETIASSWKDCIESHISQEFLAHVTRLFAESICMQYPAHFSDEAFVRGLRAGVRGVDDFSAADVLLDAQICINTPASKMNRTVRGPHVDIGNKLFAGLFYLRHPDDDSEGGDLEIYRWKRSPRFFSRQYAPKHCIERGGTIPYRHNTLVVFLNSPFALHGVTPRGPSRFPRMFMNLLGEVESPLFDLRAYEEGFFSKIVRKGRSVYNE